MDNFINLAKQGVDAYQKSTSQTDVSKTGGKEYNSPHHSDQHSSSGYEGPKFDEDEVVRTAKTEGSGSSDLFSTALGFLGNNKEKHKEPIDEDEVIQNHRKAYEKNDAGSMTASSLGSAAALQVLKQFTSGTGSAGASGGSQTKLISLAMAEATKLFDKSGGKASGDKQDAVNGAAMTVMKLLVQSKYGGGTTGGSNSGGLGSVMSLASKFM